MILTVLLNHAGEDGRSWPSHATIAKQTGLAERSVWGHMKELEFSGWLRRSGNIGRVGVFNVLYPAAPAPSIPQMVRDTEKPIPQLLRNDPASVAEYPATPAVLSRNSCGLTTQEPPNNQPSNHPKAGKPPEDGGGPSKQKAKPSKPDWREWNQKQAEEANATPLPLLVTPDFRQAWQRWRSYRTRRATQVRISSEAITWTVDAAEAGLRECERAAQAHGWPAIIARIDQAIAGNWQGINTDRMNQPQGRGSFQTKPRHAAYDTETAKAGYSTAEINSFIPEPP